jgi:hypothetical protein
MANQAIECAWHWIMRVRNLWIFPVMFILLASAGCSENSSSPSGFVATPVPSDFAIEIDQNNDTYFSRLHVRQVITASDMMSRTTYINLSDYNGGVASKYTVNTKLTMNQIQAMWNAVCENNLLEGASSWTFWQTPVDEYQQRNQLLQIRANGMQQVYSQINHWDDNKLPLVFLCQTVEAPIGQDVKPQMPPTTAPATAPGK